MQKRLPVVTNHVRPPYAVQSAVNQLGITMFNELPKPLSIESSELSNHIKKMIEKEDWFITSIIYRCMAAFLRG